MFVSLRSDVAYLTSNGDGGLKLASGQECEL